jgi:acyl-CoA-binding protein
MYRLINAGKATMQELKTCYTLDEALKLYALFRMDNDIEAAHSREMSEQNRRR